MSFFLLEDIFSCYLIFWDGQLRWGHTCNIKTNYTTAHIYFFQPGERLNMAAMIVCNAYLHVHVVENEFKHFSLYLMYWSEVKDTDILIVYKMFSLVGLSRGAYVSCLSWSVLSTNESVSVSARLLWTMSQETRKE